MSLTAFAIWGMMKLQHSGNVKANDFVGKTGTVYMKIPGGGAYGKITIVAGGATHEVAAVAEEEIAKGTPVRVVEVIEQSLYRVEKI